jgi:hypothetical protein
MSTTNGAKQGGATTGVASRAIRGLVIGLIEFGLGIVIAVATVPLILQYWTQEKYAVWLAIFSFCALVRTIDVGHTVYLGNEFLQLANMNRMAYARAFGSGIRMALLLAAVPVALTVTVILTGALPRVLGVPLGPELAEVEGAVMAMAIGWWWSAPVAGIVMGLYPPAGDFVSVQWWAIAYRIVLCLALVVPPYFGGGLLAVGLCSGIGMVVYTLAFLYDAWRRYPEMRSWWREGSWRLGARNIRLSFGTALNTATTQLSTSGLSLVVGGLFGGPALASLTTMRTLTNAASVAGTITVTPILPDLVRFRVNEDWTKLRASVDAGLLSTCVVVNFGLVVTFPFIDQLYVSWTRGQLQFDAPLYAALAWTVIVSATGTAALRYHSAMNRLVLQGWSNALYLATLAVLVTVFARDIALWGIGVVLGVAELGRSVLALAAFGRELPAAESRALRGTMIHIFASVLVSGLALLVSACVPAWSVGICWGACLVLLPLYFYQWRALDPGVRARLAAVFPRR